MLARQEQRDKRAGIKYFHPYSIILWRMTLINFWNCGVGDNTSRKPPTAWPWRFVPLKTGDVGRSSRAWQTPLSFKIRCITWKTPYLKALEYFSQVRRLISLLKSWIFPLFLLQWYPWPSLFLSRSFGGITLLPPRVIAHCISPFPSLYSLW